MHYANILAFHQVHNLEGKDFLINGGNQKEGVRNSVSMEI